MIRIVPKTPTDEMVEAMSLVAFGNTAPQRKKSIEKAYSAMIQAAPVVNAEDLWSAVNVLEALDKEIAATGSTDLRCRNIAARIRSVLEATP